VTAIGTLIGLDIGSSAVKAAAFDEGGEQLRVVRVDCPSAGEFAPARWWAAACEALVELGGRDAAAVGVCGRGGTNVLLGEAGEVLGPSWDDARAHEHLRRARAEFGSSLSPQSLALLAKARWWEERYGRVATVCTAKDYVTFQLTGRLVSDPASGGAVPGGRPPLVPARPPWAPAGETADRASKAGLPPGIPVAVGWHDGAAATFGAGAADAGYASITLGTHAVYRVVTAAIPPTLRKYWDLTPGLTVTGGDILSAGRAHDWARRLLAGDAAESPRGSSGVLFLPQLGGRIAPTVRFDVRAGWHGLEARHTGADLLRSVSEGVAFALRQVRDWLGGEGLVANRTIATGGGARSPIQAQILAEVLGCDVTVATCEEGCRGAALLGTVAAGLMPLETARRLRPAATHYSPARDNVGVYDAMFARWLALQAATDRLEGPAG
jgi:sugar (pentulose or hexulose) kinase